MRFSVLDQNQQSLGAVETEGGADAGDDPAALCVCVCSQLVKVGVVEQNFLSTSGTPDSPVTPPPSPQLLSLHSDIICLCLLSGQ